MAGVRFRARRLSVTLHPTIPVHAPLVFELIDLWNQRSIAGGTYYVTRPNGILYQARPADAAEAARRRDERFQINKPSPLEIQVPNEEINPIFPFTLDLRLPQSTVPAPKVSGADQ